MNDNLLKLNNIRTHNQVLRLKNENKEKDKKMEKVVSKCKEIALENQVKNNDIIFEMNEKMVQLQKEKEKLEIKIDYYESILNKIPKIILRMFIGKK